VIESIEVLAGGGPPDVRELTLELAAAMLVLADLAPSAADARARAEQVIASGAARAKFRAIVEAQGGDPRVVDEPSRLELAAATGVPTPRAGTVQAIDAFAIGELLVRMGGGRARKEDRIDPSVGMRLLKKVGDSVTAGEPLAMVYGGDAAAATSLAAAYRIEEGAVAAAPLVFERLA
jgi:pyrimidine-nucleoside phosphorylase